MAGNKLFIKNMVCDRCITAVKGILEKNGIPYKKVELGEAELRDEISKDKKEKFAQDLLGIGFELIDNRKTMIIENIKKQARNYIQELPQTGKLKLSAYLNARLKYEYTYLSDLFSSVEGSTIEHYFIAQRIEKVKELLVYDQLSLSEIAYELGFSSVHHLSTQFKKVTGLTPTHFKKIGADKRKALDKA